MISKDGKMTMASGRLQHIQQDGNKKIKFGGNIARQLEDGAILVDKIETWRVSSNGAVVQGGTLQPRSDRKGAGRGWGSSSILQHVKEAEAYNQ